MQTVIEPGMVLDGHRLVHVLGRGGFGEVWEAEHLSTENRVAIKFLKVDFMSQSDGLGLQERFREEARILTQLDHPGVVRILGVIDQERPQILAYIMERLYGQSLEDLKDQIEVGALVHALRRVAEALDYLHGRDIIHRDVKAGNVFVCDLEPEVTGRPIKLLDFGIAKPSDAQVRTQTGVFLGTLNTMAPECFDSLVGSPAALTPAVDQWSFGVMVLRMLTGRMPFSGKTPIELVQAIRTEPPQRHPLQDTFEGDLVAERLLQVAHRCLEKAPQDRYSSMQDLAALLQEIEGDITELRVQAGQPAPSYAFEHLLRNPQVRVDGYAAGYDTWDDEAGLGGHEELLATPVEESHEFLPPPSDPDEGTLEAPEPEGPTDFMEPRLPSSARLREESDIQTLLGPHPGEVGATRGDADDPADFGHPQGEAEKTQIEPRGGRGPLERPLPVPEVSSTDDVVLQASGSSETLEAIHMESLELVSLSESVKEPSVQSSEPLDDPTQMASMPDDPFASLDAGVDSVRHAPSDATRPLDPLDALKAVLDEKERGDAAYDPRDSSPSMSDGPTRLTMGPNLSELQNLAVSANAVARGPQETGGSVSARLPSFWTLLLLGFVVISTVAVVALTIAILFD